MAPSGEGWMARGRGPTGRAVRSGRHRSQTAPPPL